MSEILLSIVIAVASLAVGSAITIVVARRYYRRGGISYYLKDFDLLDTSSYLRGDSVKITADGKAVNELRTAKCAIWNSGTVCYAGEDISKVDPLLIKISNAPFLQVLEHRQSRSAVSATIVPEDGSIRVSFETFDENDWIILRILYDKSKVEGATRDAPDVTGSVRNLPSGLSFVDLEDYVTERLVTRRLLGWFISIVSIFSAVVIYLANSSLHSLEAQSGQHIEGLAVMTWGMYISVTIMIAASLFYSYSRWLVLRNKVPKTIIKYIR